MSKLLVIVRGDIANGFEIVGPFDTYNDAEHYMDLNHTEEVYTVMTLTEPE